MKRSYFKILAIMNTTIALTACSSQPPRPAPVAPHVRSGEEMLRESQGIAQMGERWLSGRKKVDHGEEMVREGQARIEEGQRQIDEGRRIMKESEAGYHGIKQ